MAQRLEHFNATVAGNAQARQTLAFAGGDGTVVAITVRFPSGCADLVGAQVFYGDLQVIPKTLGAFLRGNAQDHRIDTSDYPTGTGWTTFLRSTDRYPHTLRFDFEVNEVALADPLGGAFPPIVLVPLDVSLTGSLLPTLGDLPPIGGGVLPIITPPGGTGSGADLQATLDRLRVSILSAANAEARAGMQQLIDELVALGYH